MLIDERTPLGWAKDTFLIEPILDLLELPQKTKTLFIQFQFKVMEVILMMKLLAKKM